MLIDFKTSFLEEIEEHYASAIEEDSFGLRPQAWDKFQSIGLPQKKSETFRYFPLTQFYKRPYRPASEAFVQIEEIAQHTPDEFQGATVVYVNGRFMPQLSQLEALEGACSVLSLEEAMRSYGAFIRANMSKSIKKETSPFALLNAALHQNAAFIYIPKKMHLDQPIQVLHFVTPCSEEAFLNPRLHVFMGEEAKAQLAFKHIGASDASCICNLVLDFQLDASSSLDFEELVLDASQSYSFTSLRAQQKESARLRAFHMTEGSQGVHLDDQVELLGEKASCDLGGLGLLAGTYAQAHVLVEHAAESCTSSQLFKNILKADTNQQPAKSSFEGKIYVHSVAQKTDAFQLSNNLILDEASTAYARPNLEIFADDVKASHGATTAQIDAEALFYLQSRGVPISRAKELLAQAYCREVTELLFSQALKHEMDLRIRKYAQSI